MYFVYHDVDESFLFLREVLYFFSRNLNFCSSYVWIYRPHIWPRLSKVMRAISSINIFLINTINQCFIFCFSFRSYHLLKQTYLEQENSLIFSISYAINGHHIRLLPSLHNGTFISTCYVEHIAKSWTYKYFTEYWEFIRQSQRVLNIFTI